MGDLKKYQLSAEDKKKLEDVAKEQEISRKNIEKKQMEKNRRAKQQEYAGISATKEDR